MATPTQMAGMMAGLFVLMLLGAFVTHEMRDRDAVDRLSREVARNRDLLADVAADLRGGGSHGVGAVRASSSHGASGLGAASGAAGGSGAALPKRNLFIIINSYVGAEARRSAARSSWVRQLRALHPLDAAGGPEVEARFFVGSVADAGRMAAVREEQKTHSDLVVVNFTDGYSTLGEKVPLLYRETLARVDPLYVCKVDDDTWVNVGVLPALLSRMRPARTYLGLMMEGMDILRGSHKNAENKLPKSMTKFPPYASGCFTIISRDLAQLLAKPPIVPMKMVNDDAFFGILFFPFEVTRLQETRIHPWGVDKCKPSDQIAGIHYVPPQCFPRLSRNASQGLPICNSKAGCR